MLRAPVAQICLRRAQMVPVGFRLHPEPFDGSELAVNAEQPLDDTLRLLVASLAEMVIADDPVRVEEVERGPVVVVEGRPDRVLTVDRDRVVDRSLHHRVLYAVDLALERE